MNFAALPCARTANISNRGLPLFVIRGALHCGFIGITCTGFQCLINVLTRAMLK
jgi:hypothetical protein